MPGDLEVTGAGIAGANGVYSKIDGQTFCGVAAVEIWQKQGSADFAILRGPIARVPVSLKPWEFDWQLDFWMLVENPQYQKGNPIRMYHVDSNEAVEDIEKVQWKLGGGDDPVPSVTILRKRCFEDIADVMENAWKQRKFTDAELVCCGVRIPVHRSTLAAASPVFEAAFSSGMQEGVSAVFEVKHASPEVVEAMLCLIYTGELPPVELLPEVHDLSMMYELKGPAKATALKMTEEVSIENVKSFLTVLKQHSPNNASVKEALEKVVRKVRDSPTDDLLLALV